MLVTWSTCKKSFDKRLVINNAGNIGLLSKLFLQALHVTSITYNKPFIKTFFAGAPCYQHYL
jgi:hypothetical protein